MKTLLMRTVHFLKRHPLMAAALLLAGLGGTALAVSPSVREQARQANDAVLAWAGISGATAGDQTWWCPMDPQIKRKKPGTCPICNMALVPLEGKEGKKTHLTLTARQIQQAGVVTEPVRKMALYREIDTTGRIDYDERRLETIVSRVRGQTYIRELLVDYLYTEVKKGQVLARLYSRELDNAQSDYLRALEMRDLRLKSRPRESDLELDLVGASEQILSDQGMTTEQIQELKKTRKKWDYVPIKSPISGTVIKLHVREGDYVREGDKLFEVADLSRFWLQADVYEDELPLIKVGQPAEVTVRSLPGVVFPGEVEFKDPVVNLETRTARVRVMVQSRPETATARNASADTGESLSVDDNGPSLRPGMFARVRLKSVVGEQLAVPESAVLWSGQRRVVIVREGLGTFRPREVRLGPGWLYPLTGRPATSGNGSGGQSDQARAETAGSLASEFEQASMLAFGAARRRYHVVRQGLQRGEEVVTAATFLLNAESSFQQVLMKMLPRPGEPEESESYDPEVEKSLAELSSDDRQLARRQRICPVTGKALGSMGKPPAVSVDDGKVFVCCEGCEAAVRENPKKYLDKLRQGETGRSAKPSSAPDKSHEM